MLWAEFCEKNKDSEIVQEILKQPDRDGILKIILQVEHSECDIVRYLLYRFLHYKNSISFAINTKDLPLVNFLMEKKFPVDIIVFNTIIKKCKIKFFERIYKYATENFPEEDYENLYSECMVYAVENNLLAFTKYFYEKISNKKILENSLIYAAYSSADKTFFFLVERGVKLRKNIFTQNCVNEHKKEASLKILQYLIDNGVDIHRAGNALLTRCIHGGDVDFVSFCIKNGAYIHLNNEKPLAVAVKLGYLDVVKLLLDNGACAAMIKRDDIFYSCDTENFLEIIELLINKGTPYSKFKSLKNTISKLDYKLFLEKYKT